MRSAATMILVAAAVGATTGFVLDRGDPPPLTAQLDDIVARADDEGQYPADRRTVQLHPGSPSSYVFVLRDESDRPGGIPREFSSPPSDEIRVYDAVDGRLDLRMRFHPQNHGQVTQEPDGDAPGFRFRILDIDDINTDGTVEILASFERLTYATGALPVPVVISWDRGEESYAIHPLLARHPRLRVSHDLSPAAYDGYRKPTLIQDQFSSTQLIGHPADLIVVRRALRGPVLMAAYPELSPLGFTGRHEVKGWFLDLNGALPRLTSCSPKDDHLFVRPPDPVDLPDALAGALIGSADEPGCGQA
jgi:hypothetical protein